MQCIGHHSPYQTLSYGVKHHTFELRLNQTNEMCLQKFNGNTNNAKIIVFSQRPDFSWEIVITVHDFTKKTAKKNEHI